MMYYFQNELYHHGKKYMKWGVQNGPPYPLYRQKRFRDGGEEAYLENQRKVQEKLKQISSEKVLDTNTAGAHYKYSEYGKQHVDFTLNKGTKLQTMTKDEDLTARDMYYATYTSRDKAYYKTNFNPVFKEPIVKDGKIVGNKTEYKFDVTTKLIEDAKIASEDASVKALKTLYTRDKDFRDYVGKRLIGYAKDTPYFPKKEKQSYHSHFKDIFDTVDKMQDPDYEPDDSDFRSLNKLFSFVIPNDGHHSKNSEKVAADVYKQRNKMFGELKKNGYSGLLDVNDALYYTKSKKTKQSPVIVFDMDKIVTDKVKKMTWLDPYKNVYVYMGRQIIDSISGV